MGDAWKFKRKCVYSFTFRRFRHNFRTNNLFFRVHERYLLKAVQRYRGVLFICFIMFTTRNDLKGLAPLVVAMNLYFRIFVEDPRGKRALGGGQPAVVPERRWRSSQQDSVRNLWNPYASPRRGRPEQISRRSDVEIIGTRMKYSLGTLIKVIWMKVMKKIKIVRLL